MNTLLAHPMFPVVGVLAIVMVVLILLGGYAGAMGDED